MEVCVILNVIQWKGLDGKEIMNIAFYTRPGRKLCFGTCTLLEHRTTVKNKLSTLTIVLLTDTFIHLRALFKASEVFLATDSFILNAGLHNKPQ